METTTIRIGGMSCQGCVTSVTRVLGAIPGVRDVRVSLERGEAMFSYDACLAGAADFRRAVEDAGFDPE